MSSSNDPNARSGDAWRNPAGFSTRSHAYDPHTQPELFRGVFSRRFIAFLIDLVILAVPVLLSVIFIVVFGIITLGLGFLLFGLFWPGLIIWALIYYGACCAGPHSATIGMRVMDLQMRTWDGAPCDFLRGAIHAVLFWVCFPHLTIVLVVVGLFDARSRMLHDIVSGTVVINSFRGVPVQVRR
jgi:uncharacterized RDD family membrane protein YckC